MGFTLHHKHNTKNDFRASITVQLSLNLNKTRKGSPANPVGIDPRLQGPSLHFTPICNFPFHNLSSPLLPRTL